MKQQDSDALPGTTHPVSPDEAWSAVASRDRRFDGHFVYAVTTTGIFCRPSCPSRKPHRNNVAFFDSPAGAQAAGYRACLRCRPMSPAGTPAEEAVEAARSYLEAHLDEKVTLEDLAAHAGLSPYHLQRLFVQFVGLSPSKYQNARRLEVFKDQVGDESDVLEAAYEAGFGSSRALYDQADSALGMTPGSYRRGGEGIDIRYTTLTSAFGWILIAATPRGICAVSLGDDPSVLAAGLTEEFSNAASIERDDDGIGQWAEPIVAYLEGDYTHPSVPLDLQGTDFQRRVWAGLQKIPYGETRSYGELAEMLGRPGSARAVARACATNKAALVVPCHRVVRGNGEISGYRWGVDKKRRLLQLEHRPTD